MVWNIIFSKFIPHTRLYENSVEILDPYNNIVNLHRNTKICSHLNILQYSMVQRWTIYPIEDHSFGGLVSFREGYICSTKFMSGMHFFQKNVGVCILLHHFFLSTKSTMWYGYFSIFDVLVTMWCIMWVLKYVVEWVFFICFCSDFAKSALSTHEGV